MNAQIEYLSDINTVNADIVADAREFVHTYSDTDMHDDRNNVPSRIFLTYDSEQNFRLMCKALGIPKFAEKDGRLFLPWSDAADVERVQKLCVSAFECLGPDCMDMRLWLRDRVLACGDRLNFLNRRAQREERRNKMEFVNPAGDKVGDKRPAKFLAKKAAKSAESKAIRSKMQSVKGSKK